MTSLVSEPMKPQYGFLWESCSMRSVCSRCQHWISCQQDCFIRSLSTLRQLITVGNEIAIILWSQAHVYITIQEGSVLEPQLVSGNVIIRTREEAGEGAVRGGGQGGTLLRQEKKRSQRRGNCPRLTFL